MRCWERDERGGKKGRSSGKAIKPANSDLGQLTDGSIKRPRTLRHRSPRRMPLSYHVRRHHVELQRDVLEGTCRVEKVYAGLPDVRTVSRDGARQSSGWSPCGWCPLVSRTLGPSIHTMPLVYAPVACVLEWCCHLTPRAKELVSDETAQTPSLSRGVTSTSGHDFRHCWLSLARITTSGTAGCAATHVALSQRSE